MIDIVTKLRGDKGIWAIVFLLALVSFLPVYSASTNLVHVIGKGSTWGYLMKHLGHLFLGFMIIYFVHKVPYHYFRALSIFGIPVIIVLLLYTLYQGTTIDGANASRWLRIPFVGSFQTSTFAFTILMVYVARYLAKIEGKIITFKESFLELWLPVFGVLILILPANFSTTALIFAMVCMLVYIGYYPLKYLGGIIAMGVVFLAFFILLAKALPDAMPNRVKTWESRIDRFFDDTPNPDDNYQIEKAKIAIASGGMIGLGPGRSVQKNFLPQSSSDFIFAIIVEEYGMSGAFTIIFLYMLLFLRFIINAHKTTNLFGKLLIIGLGFPIIFQALTNMMVAVELLPVTGQTLPLISAGGTSIWMTCAAIGIILSVTKKEEEIALDLEDKLKKQDALQRIIDREVDSSLDDFSIDDETSKNEKNPLEPILNK